MFVVIALCLSFYLGYKLGVSDSKPRLSTNTISTSNSDTHESALGITQTHEVATDALDTPANALETNALEVDELIETQNNTNISNDIVDLFSELISLQHSSSDYRLYGSKIDEIRQRLIDNPTDIAIISEHFETLATDSNESYVIVSILQGLPDKQGVNALTQLALQSLDYSNEKGNQQFLEIVGRTGLTNESITNGLKNIALYGELSEQRLYALDMLMPFQLTQNENQAVLAQLSQMQLSNEDQGKANYLFGQTLRFSDSQSRTELALNTLQDDSIDINRQSIVLDFIELGQIEKSQATKETLFALARSQGHPLQENAIKVLVSSFDINQEEYQELLTFDGIELPVLR
ncbi:hypothetical protein KUL10_00520 [Glaciecola sp. KUL10]|nr:hypothetical protein KUL10_00520 [Glaciecola sp. KUL10]